MFLYLRILVLVELVAAVIFEEPTVMAHFTQEDIVRLTLWRADLVLEIDLDAMFSDIRATCGLLGIYNGTSIPKEVFAHLVEVCDFDMRHWETYDDFLTGTAGRKPRFILATLLSSLVMGVGGYIFGSSHSTSQTDVQLMANQKHFVQLLRENDHRAVLMQSEMHDLATYVHRNADSAKTALILLSIFFMQAKQLASIFRGFDTLIVEKKISPSLIASDILGKKYQHLQEQVRRQGKSLAITSEIALFDCKVSFATFTNGKLRVVIHIHIPALFRDICL